MIAVLVTGRSVLLGTTLAHDLRALGHVVWPCDILQGHVTRTQLQ